MLEKIWTQSRRGAIDLNSAMFAEDDSVAIGAKYIAVLGLLGLVATVVNELRVALKLNSNLDVFPPYNWFSIK